MFASCGGDGAVRVWDTRARGGRCMLQAAAHACDVNVIAWSPLVTFLLLSGADDGGFKIWDRRRFAAGGGSAAGAEPPLPLANFAWHRQAITSLEWAPDDENVFAVSSADNQVTMWDMSLEADDDAELALARRAGAGAGEDEAAAASAALPSSRDPRLADIPPQLLFIHAGMDDPKEVHFHRQLPGTLLAASANGLDIFQPDVSVVT